MSSLKSDGGDGDVEGGFTYVFQLILWVIMFIPNAILGVFTIDNKLPGAKKERL